jgi:formylglycine-generating enzyme required for sulfatase activity
MKFVPVPIIGGPTDGTSVLFCVWETRVRDFRAFVQGSGYDYKSGEGPTTLGPEWWTWSDGVSWSAPGFDQTEDGPVTCVSWEDAKAFCAWLSRLEGRGYRLPSDHEWSCAAGLAAQEDPNALPADKTSNLPGTYTWGSAWPPPAGAGNFAGTESKIGKEPDKWLTIAGYNDAFPRTAPSGRFAANPFGIYDLAGNVWEWCEDWYNAKHGERVLRGGSWAVSEKDLLRACFRDRHRQTFRNDSHGFRVVIELPEPARDRRITLPTPPAAKPPSI